MNENRTERFESWTSPGTGITVEYDVNALDEIRQYALYGFRLLSRGGMELAGVLFGTRQDNVLRIQTWRPIDCEHANGPTLQLSAKDRANLISLLHSAQTNPDLKPYEILGWFVSHTKDGAGMSENDAAIFNEFFAEPWQLTLVLQSLREAVVQASFFLRAPGGSLDPESGRHDFTLSPLPSDTAPPPKTAERVQVFDHPRARLPDLREFAEGKVPDPRAADQGGPGSASVPGPGSAPASAPEPGPDPAPAPEPEMFATTRVGFLGGRQIWIWSFMGLLMAVVGVVLTWKPSPKASRSIALHVADSGGQLLLQWDQNAAPIQKAVRGTLDIKDGNTNIQLPLDAAKLREGSFRYTRLSGDQEVVMSVYPADAPPVQESARFVGPPPPGPVVPDAEVVLREERDKLAAENQKLKEELKAETAKRERLEEQLKNRPKERAAAPGVKKAGKKAPRKKAAKKTTA